MVGCIAHSGPTAKSWRTKNVTENNRLFAFLNWCRFGIYSLRGNCSGIKWTASTCTLMPIISVWKIIAFNPIAPSLWHTSIEPIYTDIFRRTQTDWRNSPERAGAHCVRNTKCNAFQLCSGRFLFPFAYAITWFWQWLHVTCVTAAPPLSNNITNSTHTSQRKWFNKNGGEQNENALNGECTSQPIVANVWICWIRRKSCCFKNSTHALMADILAKATKHSHRHGGQYAWPADRWNAVNTPYMATNSARNHMISMRAFCICLKQINSSHRWQKPRNRHHTHPWMTWWNLFGVCFVS